MYPSVLWQKSVLPGLGSEKQQKKSTLIQRCLIQYKKKQGEKDPACVGQKQKMTEYSFLGELFL